MKSWWMKKLKKQTAGRPMKKLTAEARRPMKKTKKQTAEEGRLIKKPKKQMTKEGRPMKGWGLKTCTTAHQADAAKIFVFLEQPPGTDFCQCLFAIDIPDLGGGVIDPGPSRTRTVATTRVTTVATIFGEDIERERQVVVEGEGAVRRQKINPFMFRSKDWPTDMSSALVNKYMFFFGGRSLLEYQRDVFVLDMSASSSSQLILDQGPPLNSGKVLPVVQVVGTRILVLSGNKCCPYAPVKGRQKFYQLEILDVGASVVNWQVGAKPPFDNASIEGCTLVEESKAWVILTRRLRRAKRRVYAYHLELDSWEELDKRQWVGKDKTFPPWSGHITPTDESITMGDYIYSVKTLAQNAIPVLVKRKRAVGVGEGHENEEHFDVIRYRMVECLDWQSCALVHLGGTKMACLQVWNPDSDNPYEDSNGDETYVDISFIDTEGSTPKYLTSSHFVTEPRLEGCISYAISDANMM